jgi:hypothetical protein
MVSPHIFPTKFWEVFPIILDILKNKEQELHEAYLKQIDQEEVFEIISGWSISINHVINTWISQLIPLLAVANDGTRPLTDSCS